MTTHYIGNYWRVHNPDRSEIFDATRWNRFAALNEDNIPNLVNYSITEGGPPVGRIGADGLEVFGELPQTPQARKNIIEGLQAAMENHNPNLMSLISELIQNAMDQGATKIRMAYADACLQFAHNGTVNDDLDGEPFTGDQLNALFHYGGRHKRNSIASEGRFGIGFKYWITMFERLTVRARYQCQNVLRIDVASDYSLNSVGLCIREPGGDALFEDEETTLFEFHTPIGTTEQDCQQLEEHLDERILTSIPMMAASRGGHLEIEIGQQTITCDLELWSDDDPSHSIYTYQDDEGGGWITEFLISDLITRWNWSEQYRQVNDAYLFNRLKETILAGLHQRADWKEADTNELLDEYRNAKIRLIFPNTAEEGEVRRGMAGSLFAAPESLFDLPCDVQAPWMLNEDRKSVFLTGGNEPKREWNKKLVELAYRAYLESLLIFTNGPIDDGDMPLEDLQKILLSLPKLSESQVGGNKGKLTSNKSITDLKSVWLGERYNHQHLARPGLALLMNHLQSEGHTATLSSLEGLCPNVLSIGPEDSFLPIFDWKVHDDEDPPPPSIIVYAFDEVLTNLIQDSLNPEIEEGIDPSFLSCFGTVVTHALGNGEIEFNFQENLNRTQDDISASVINRYPDSEHGKMTLHLFDMITESCTYCLPTEEQNFGRSILEDVISGRSTLSLRAHLTDRLEWLHLTTCDPAILFLEMETEPTHIFQSLKDWAAETDGLIEEFIVLINGDTIEPSFALVPKSDEQWVHIRGAKRAYGGKVRTNAAATEANPRVVELIETSMLGVYEHGIPFENPVPVPEILLDQDSVWSQRMLDPKPRDVPYWFGRLNEAVRPNPGELGQIAYPKGYSLESILGGVSGEIATELKKQLLPVFIDFIRIDPGEEPTGTKLNAARRLLPELVSPANPYPRYPQGDNRRYEITTLGNLLAPPENDEGLDLITRALRPKEQIESLKKGGVGHGRDFVRRLPTSWKINNGVLISRGDVLSSGLILRIFQLQDATEDRLWRSMNNDLETHKNMILQVSKAHHAAKDFPTLPRKVFGVSFARGSADTQAKVNLQNIGSAFRPGESVYNLVGEDYLLNSEAFSTLRTGNVATFQPYERRLKAGSRGWQKNKTNTHEFLNETPWLPLFITDSWDDVNQYLTLHREQENIPFPVPVFDDELLSGSANITPAHPLRAGVEQLIQALAVPETQPTACRWLDALFSNGMGNGGINTSLRNALQTLVEADVVLDAYPNLSEILQNAGNNATGDYQSNIRRLKVGATLDEVDFHLPQLVLDEDQTWYTNLEAGVSLSDVRETDVLLDVPWLEVGKRIPRQALVVPNEQTRVMVLPSLNNPRIQNEIVEMCGIQVVTLNDLARDGLGGACAEQETELQPRYMEENRSSMGQIFQIIVCDSLQPQLPLHLGPIAPRLEMSDEGGPVLSWCNPPEAATGYEQHEWIGRILYNAFEDILNDGAVNSVLQRTSCVLVEGWDVEDTAKNEFITIHIPSSLSEGLRHFLESLNGENISEKLTELTNEWFRDPNPEAIIKCGLSTVSQWYEGIPSLAVDDFTLGEVVNHWVPITHATQAGSNLWMNLTLPVNHAPPSQSVLMNNPCNLFLCNTRERYNNIERIHDGNQQNQAAWNFFSSDVRTVVDYMREVLESHYDEPNPDRHIHFQGLLATTRGVDVPIRMNLWHAVLMFGWLSAWCPG
jgi:hypothetical protein